MIELLAPAKDKICAKAAIDFGADALYIGASDFGARKNVPNTLEDIKEVVDYAHKFNVKVYAAINTILTDDELLKAKKLIKNLVEIGVDAVIIQDMGLVDISSEIPIHASTQCDNRTVEKVKFLQDVGFSRVVLARELSLEQIKEIKRQTDVELEVFIHGALCVSYSGQCYLSQAIGGRSANRGECAQPCRKKYSLQDENGNFIAKDKHLLCLKDFNASKHIKELADAGVTSLKIEGRLKDVDYVKNVVAYYRKLIDNLGLKKSSSGTVVFDFEPDLNKSFNRGFTDYFLKKRGECHTFDSPKSRGEFIGKVVKIETNCFEIFSSNSAHANVGGISINPQDGLCFFDGDTFSGCLVNKVEGRRIYPNKMVGIQVDKEIYRNFDAEFDKKLKNSKTCRKISVSIEFGLNKIKAVDEDNNSAQISYKFEEFAQNAEKMSLNIINQFEKSAQSEFLAKDVQIITDKVPFLPVSKLNELRRELFGQLSDVRSKSYKRADLVESKDDALKHFSSTKLDYRANILNESAKKFYEDLGFEIEEPALESKRCSSAGKTVMSCKHCLKYASGLCKDPRKFYLIDEKNKRYELSFNCDKCEMEIIF